MSDRRFPEHGEDLRERALRKTGAPAETDGTDRPGEAVPAGASEHGRRTPPATPAPAPPPPPAAVADAPSTADAGRFISADAATKLRDRWRGIQLDFVDDPGRSVEEADELLRQAAMQITQGIEASRQALAGARRPSSPPTGAADDHGASTEQLRTTLQQYRDLMNRILNT
jgi:hypothetical protein